MSLEGNTPEMFKYGADWLRADFHLHTRADKEFRYTGEENSFVSDYIAGLKNAGIQVGTITNHNKFDISEFKALRKKARKEAICLLPGVELSVNDGANGIHTLVVFNDEWLPNGQDYINQFLNVAFEGKTPEQYERENGRSSLDLITTIKKLEGYHRDFFIMFAHVRQNSGLWKALDGGRLQDMGENEVFKRRTLAFQKVRSHNKSDEVCRTKVKGWLGDWYPAEVEGSDCKSIPDIGKGGDCFIKLGAFSFDAVKFALIDKSNRIASNVLKHTHSRILNIRFTGGTLTGQELHFSPELNTLIGIRGSGKSSILEALRYAINIPFGEKAGDIKYKEDLVGFTMGSGGKIEIDVIDRYGQTYTIRRVWKEPYSEVLINNMLQPGVSIRETVLHKPIYFGQKDLSSTGEGFEKDLVDKLLGSKLDEVRRNIAQQKQRVSESVDRLNKVFSVQDQIDEQKKIKLDTEHRLKFYGEHGVEEKLQKRLDFDSDVRMINKGIQMTDRFVSDLESLLAQHEDDIRNFKGYLSKHNSDLFGRFYTHYDTYIAFVDQVKAWLANQGKSKQGLSDCRAELNTIRKSMVEEFAEIERKLGEQLKISGTQNISSEEFLDLKKRLGMAKQLIATLEKQGDLKKGLLDALYVELQKLNELWLQEFSLIKTELDKVGSGGSSISITSEYKEDKQSFLAFTKDIFRGSGIRETTYQGIVEKYTDFVAIFQDFGTAKGLFGSNPQILIDLFKKNLKTLLTYQTPNKFTILYRGKELQHHSLGQRASALILFVLSQQENDVIIIDQPEDDLDNQTIYEDVIKLIRTMKPKVQFIFATHNPNIPVLGDAEQVHACSFMDNKVSICSGSVDNQTTQRTIVNIMEGGQEAFNRRKEIYQIWKS
ncbi:MAG: AAA family ATPase [Desulfobacula sp.]|jgi:chromosome segregation protein|nr:AAA family ATPase [Desulfobacula sp.]